ncbi:MAG: hypothetical protein QME96_18370 [Myxococcota bacterium]|nr:hypothetical protein [Myxococcota bacterium]
MKKMMGFGSLMLTVLGSLAIPAPASAQEAWSMVIPACQERLTAGVDENLTSESVMTDGGNRSIHGTTSTGFRYFWCPVWVPNNILFTRIRIRALDNVVTASNDVWAGLYRQPWTSGSGNAVSLGSVTSTNSANVPNVTEASINVTIDNNNNTYYVIFRIGRTASANIIRGYQVGLYQWFGLTDEELPVQEPIDCGVVESKAAWDRTAEEADRCILPEAVWE